MITSFSDCGFPVIISVQFFLSLLDAQLDIHSTAATQLGCVEQPSPEAAQRCAAGAGLDGDEAFYCDAPVLVSLFSGFELLSLTQTQQRKPGSWHWNIVAERLPG
jgi:hypothetical protein